MRRKVALVLATVAAVLLSVAVWFGASLQGDYNQSARSVSAPGEAIVALESLDVKGRAPKTGYDRSQFGPSWKDVDENGCDTRNDILARDMEFEVLGPDGCTVESGTLQDPYTDRTLVFKRGRTTSREVQIDHVVALSDAWQKGAQGIDPGLRTALANDPLNLLAVDGPTNQQKSDSDAASWLPPNTGFRCVYVARQVSVKTKYKLWVTLAEREVMREILSTCPDQPTYS